MKCAKRRRRLSLPHLPNRLERKRVARDDEEDGHACWPGFDERENGERVPVVVVFRRPAGLDPEEPVADVVAVHYEGCDAAEAVEEGGRSWRILFHAGMESRDEETWKKILGSCLQVFDQTRQSKLRGAGERCVPASVHDAVVEKTEGAHACRSGRYSE